MRFIDFKISLRPIVPNRGRKTKVIHVLIALIVSTLYSCSLPEEGPENNSPSIQADGNYSELRFEITDTMDIDECIDEYNSLTDAEQAGVWIDKLDHTKTFFPAEQDDLLDSIKGVISSDDFDGTTDIDEEDMMTALESRFSDEEIVKIFFFLHDYDGTPDPHRFYGGGNCTCRWSIGCGQGLCEDDGCNQSSSGCGFLWLWSCTGVCDNSPYVQ